MPLFSLDIEKSFNGEFWTNRYILELDDVTAGSTVVNQIIEAEQDVHGGAILFTKARLSDMTPDTDNYVVFIINTYGHLAVSSEYLPLWNVIRCDFQVDTGRPSRKYLRCPVYESNQVAGVLTSDTITFMQENYVDVLVAIPEFVDVDGQPIVDGFVYPNVGMRQLRRGSKRRTTPIL